MSFSRCVVAMMATVSSTAHADVLFVDNCTQPGGGIDGISFSSIQAAIDAAADGDEVVVAPCTYFESIDFLGKAITLRSSDGAQVTTIDGTGSVHVVRCISGEGPETVLDGFTITGGHADVNGTFPDNSGGGMLNFLSSPTVINCTFTDNSAGFGGGMLSFGAAIVVNCTFSGNSASTGGGMYNFQTSPTVTSCTFSGNMALVFGGGMFNGLNGASPTVTNCTFSGNSAFRGGGMANSGSVPTVTNCTFSGNSAGAVGGGLFSEDGIPTASNCILWNNSPDQVFGSASVAYSDVQGGQPGTGNIDADPLFVDPDNGNFRLSADSPGIDAGDNTSLPGGIDTDLDGNPRFIEVPETPDTGNGTLPVVDMGAYESLGGGCLAVTSQEVLCHADGTTFTVNIEGLNACTGGTTQVTFTASGGAVGAELCFTTLVNDGGFCCSTEICVTIPDCAPAGVPSDLDGDGVVGITDLLALLAAWGTCADCGTPPSCPEDFDGDCSVGVLDLLILLGNWG